MQPGTPMFQRYKRCPWEIEGAPEDDEDGASRAPSSVLMLTLARLAAVRALPRAGARYAA
jgi:hypothetical protein